MKQLNHYETMDKMDSSSTELVLFLCGLTAENLGLIMRTADIFSVKTIYYLNDNVEIKQSVIKKNSRGATLPLVMTDSPFDILNSLRNDGYSIIALEITNEAIPLRKHIFEEKTCIIVGNERNGVPQELLDYVDKACYIEMIGKNISSLNVSISTAIALNKYVEQKNDMKKA